MRKTKNHCLLGYNSWSKKKILNAVMEIYHKNKDENEKNVVHQSEV